MSDKNYCSLPKFCDMFFKTGWKYDHTKTKCSTCDNKVYVRFADFEIADCRAFYERKTAADFIASRRGRLYNQLNKMDTFIEGRKGLILEGMTREIHKFNDSKDFYGGLTKRTHDLRGLSPLEQAIVLGGKDSENWTKSFIRECKMRDIEFVQTWDLNETIDFLIQCDEGYDETPKMRVVPKRYPEVTLDQNILILLNGIGKATSADLLKKYGSVANLITELREMSGSDILKSKVLQELYKVFGEPI